MQDYENELLDNFYKNNRITNLLVKVTNLCNFKCSYCFWFRDPTVLQYPKVIANEVTEAIVDRVIEYIQQTHIDNFSITLHGGEPLVLGYERFESFIRSYDRVYAETGVKVSFSVQTNGWLVDQKWCELFLKYDIAVGVSVDGPKEVHDKNRRTISGEPTFDRVASSIQLLKQNKVSFGILSVCNPESNPAQTLSFIVYDLGINRFDIMIPDITHDDPAPPIADYYNALFDVWVKEYASKGVMIRFFRNMIAGILNCSSNCESVGYGPNNVITVETNGDLGPTDTLRIAKNLSLNTGLNITTDSLNNISKNPAMRKFMLESLKLPKQCLECSLNLACGGGYLPHRWSSQTRSFQNPSVYCEQLRQMFDHVSEFVKKDVKIKRYAEISTNKKEN